MPLYREQAVVLRTQKLGEADRIVTLLAPERGLIRAVAKGVRRTSSKFGARLEPFMVAQLQLFEGRTLDTITQASTLGSYGPPISGDYDRYLAGSTMVELAERLAEGGPSRAQFALLVGALRTLAQGAIPPGLVRDGYVLRALAEAGWEPGLDECVRCGAPGPHASFSAAHGGVLCRECEGPGALRVSPAELGLIRSLLTGDWDGAVALAPGAHRHAAGIVAAYAQWHLERGLRSLSVRE